MIFRSLRAAAVAAPFFFILVTPACRNEPPAPPDTETVGVKEGNRTVVPVNQVVTPAGFQVPLPGQVAQIKLSFQGQGLIVGR